MGLVVAPILEGKLEGWKTWTSSFAGSRKAEFDAFYDRLIIYINDLHCDHHNIDACEGLC